jgi:pilus assembly protein Flp/PilA
MMTRLTAFVKEEQGQGMTEYGLVLGLIAVAVVASLIALRGNIIKLFSHVDNTVNDGVTGMTSTSTP